MICFKQGAFLLSKLRKGFRNLQLGFVIEQALRILGDNLSKKNRYYLKIQDKMIYFARFN